MVCGKHNLSKILQAIDESHPYEEPAWELYALCEKPLRETGQGRILHLSDKVLSLCDEVSAVAIVTPLAHT